MDNEADIIGVITKWNKDAGNSTDHFNGRQTALYTGLQCEELAEKLTAMGLHGIAGHLSQVGDELKQGVWDMTIRDADRQEMLDADADLMVVTIGSAASQGADFKGAMAEVIRANESKRFADGMLHKDENGKIKKPPRFKAPDLTPFVDKS
jgi:predicted HAD superfamily Cof-like phosphohydrolase